MPPKATEENAATLQFKVHVHQYTAQPQFSIYNLALLMPKQQQLSIPLAHPSGQAQAAQASSNPPSQKKNARAKPGDRVQFERKGYYVVDSVDSKPGALVFNRIVSLKDTWAKLVAK